MRGVHSAVDDIRREVFREVARLAYADCSLEEVDSRFHSRYNAVEKTYCYRVWNSPESSLQALTTAFSPAFSL